MAPQALARRIAAYLVLGGALLLSADCRHAPPDAVAVWTLEPARAIVNQPTGVKLSLRDARGPLAGARLQLEAHMSHPGMAPIVSHFVESSPASYEARVQLTMAGEWTLVASGQLANGTRISKDFKIVAGE